MNTTLGPGGEFDLIRSFLQAAGPSERPGVRVGPGDDAAVIDAGPIAVSVDLTIEGVHFRRDWLAPEQIGYRAAAAALSDLAAMAARPIGLLASLAVTAADARSGLAGRVVNGLIEAARDADAALLGGDLTRSPGPITLDVVVLGTAERPALRSGARAGDEVWVTGRLGAAAAAAAAWLAGRVPGPDARTAFARPRPRIAEAAWLAEHGLIHALIDVSDGVAGDAGHIAAASGVQVVIDVERVPVHEAAEREGAAAAEREIGGADEPVGGGKSSALRGARSRALRLALSGGEDYELLFAAPAGRVAAEAAAFESTFGIALSRIGEVREGAGVVLRDSTDEHEPTAGFSHFER